MLLKLGKEGYETMKPIMKYKAITIDVQIQAPNPNLVIEAIKDTLQNNRYVKVYCVRKFCHCGSEK